MFIKMKRNTLIAIIAALGLSLTAVHGQTSYKGWNPTWSVTSNGVSRATTTAQRTAMVNDVEDGTIDTRGTQVNVNNSAVETTGTGNRTPISNSQLKYHNPFGSTFNNPTSSRWYQLDGKTQVFRVFPGDQNMYGSRVGAGRSESFAPGLGIRKSENKTMRFTARYRVHAHNGSKDVKIFQSKATAEGSQDPAWGVALWVEQDGDIIIVKRKPKKSDWVKIDTGKDVGDSFNLRVVDDGLDYKVFINNVKMAEDSWDRGNLKSVCRWGAYVQGGTDGVLTGSVSNPEIVYVSGARVEKY